MRALERDPDIVLRRGRLAGPERRRYAGDAVLAENGPDEFLKFWQGGGR
jgi:hypothetical protein